MCFFSQKLHHVEYMAVHFMYAVNISSELILVLYLHMRFSCVRDEHFIVTHEVFIRKLALYGQYKTRQQLNS